MLPCGNPHLSNQANQMLTCVIILANLSAPIKHCHLSISSISHETLTLMSIISFHHHGSRHPNHQSRCRPPRFHIRSAVAPNAVNLNRKLDATIILAHQQPLQKTPPRRTHQPAHVSENEPDRKPASVHVGTAKNAATAASHQRFAVRQSETATHTAATSNHHTSAPSWTTASPTIVSLKPPRNHRSHGSSPPL